MRGVILAGGKATRLRPLTYVTNKHLLPIYDRPMIYYPLQAMARSGITEVLLITGPEHAGGFLNLLRSGSRFGLRLQYDIQEEAGGIAQAMGLAERFVDGEKIMMLLGDNIFTADLRPYLQQFVQRPQGAMVFVTRVEDPRQCGVVELDASGRVVSIEEKPQQPKSNLAQTGIYCYDSQVFDVIRTLAPSGRGELEVTDLNMWYVRQGLLSAPELPGLWIDAGTSHDELLRANQQVAALCASGELLRIGAVNQEPISAILHAH
ncbi:MAG: sugar phosphate nucleotidyltransferase [bacterium]|nr:sugar phosphate nucleotidyltransferase [bacterium]